MKHYISKSALKGVPPAGQACADKYLAASLRPLLPTTSLIRSLGDFIIIIIYNSNDGRASICDDKE